jgi:hypothetical protein
MHYRWKFFWIVFCGLGAFVFPPLVIPFVFMTCSPSKEDLMP